MLQTILSFAFAAGSALGALFLGASIGAIVIGMAIAPFIGVFIVIRDIFEARR